MSTANDETSINDVIRTNPKKFYRLLKQVNAANTLVNIRKTETERKRKRNRSRSGTRSRSRNGGKTVKKRKSKRRKTRLGRK